MPQGIRVKSVCSTRIVAETGGFDASFSSESLASCFQISSFVTF
jgi:hypothetical protein